MAFSSKDLGVFSSLISSSVDEDPQADFYGQVLFKKKAGQKKVLSEVESKRIEEELHQLEDILNRVQYREGEKK